MHTFSKILLALFVAVTSIHAQSFNAARDQVRKDLDIALTELTEVRSAIADEKIPLIRSVATIEDDVQLKRSELERLRRLRDNSDMGLNRLRDQVQALREQNEYAAGLLDEFVRSFETRIDYS
ncbi:MAG: biopolymer transport protein ExbB, partial [Candidatus Azotimanducaceae bacterium]